MSAAGTAQKSKFVSNSITRATVRMYDTLHLPARLVPRPRVTSPQLPSFRQRIAAVQERDECLSAFPSEQLAHFLDVVEAEATALLTWE